jgi:hypothetical protein
MKQLRMVYYSVNPRGMFRFGYADFLNKLDFMEIQSEYARSGTRLSVRFTKEAHD